jgi:hypothetical protein
VLVPACSLMGSAQARELRLHQRDGRNAAILLAGLRGGDLREILNRDVSLPDLGANTLLGVHVRAAELSCPSRILELTYAELMAAPAPVVVLLRTKQHGDGYFCVVLNARRNEVTLLASGLMVVQEISEDNFRKQWTGHAVVPTLAIDTTRYPTICCLALGAVLAVVAKRVITAHSSRKVQQCAAWEP